MSVSGTPAAADINLDEFERRLRAPCDQQAAQLAEFVRIIESYGIRPVRSPSPDETLSTPGGTDPEPTQSPEAARLQPSTALAVDEPSETACVDVEAPQPFEFGDPPLHAPEPAGFATKPRSGVRSLKASALALAGAALIGAGLGVKTGMPKAPSFVAAPQGPATAAQPSHDIVAASTVADATPLKDTAQPAPAKTVGSDESPTELGARVSLGNMPELPALASVSANAAQPAKQASTELAAEAPVNLSIVASPAASQVPDSRRCSRGLAAAGRDAKRDSVALRHGLDRGAAREQPVAAARQTGSEGGKGDRRCCAAPHAQTRFAHEAFDEIFRPARYRQG